MTRSGYWYIRLLTRHEVRPLYFGLLTGVAFLLIFFIWLAIANLLGGEVHFSIAHFLFQMMFVAVASYSVGATVHTLEMTPRDVLALAPALALDEKSLAREAATITEQSSAIHIWTLGWIVTTIVLTWWISPMVIDDIELIGEFSLPSIAGWPYFRNLIYVFALSQLIWIEIALARRLGKLLGEHGRVNLLDRTGLRALSKRTRRSVLM
jgi:hypothetical protein